jgi:hypothetical protein
MRLRGIALTALLVITVVYTVACSSSSTPGPTPSTTSTPIPTTTHTTSDGVSGSQSGFQAYTVAQNTIDSAIVFYISEHQGNFPYLTGSADTYPVSHCTNCHILDMNLLIQGGMLNRVPAGAYSASGAKNDNCDGGASGCLTGNHYIWIIDKYGNLYSACIGSDCDSNNLTGYQGVWP